MLRNSARHSLCSNWPIRIHYSARLLIGGLAACVTRGRCTCLVKRDETEAGDEHAAIALARGKARIYVCVRGAAARRRLAVPLASERADKVDEILAG